MTFSSFTPSEKLSSLELDVIKLLVQGLSVEDIANRLGKSESAVKTRLSAARTKMNCNNNVQLVYQAMHETC